MEWESFWKNDQAVYSAQPYLITDALLENRVPNISMVLKRRVTWLLSMLKNFNQQNFLGCAAADGFSHCFKTHSEGTYSMWVTNQARKYRPAVEFSKCGGLYVCVWWPQRNNLKTFRIKEHDNTHTAHDRHVI